MQRIGLKTLKEIGITRLRHQKEKASLDMFQPIIAAEFPGKVVSVYLGGFRYPRMTIHRNNALKPRNYVELTYQEDGTWRVSSYDYQGNLKRNRGIITKDNIFSAIRSFIHTIDTSEDYTDIDVEKCLINVTETKDGFVTLSVLERDEKGRFKSNPKVEKGHELLPVQEFGKMISKRVSVISYKNSKHAVVIKGRLATV